jgi:penicillin-binding protein 1A
MERDFTPASIIVDGPIALPDNNGMWMPHNYEDKFFGPTTLREALTFSRNVVTVKLALRLGLPYLINYARRIGIQSPLAPNLSMALGSSEVTPIELASAYQVLANQGRRIEPTFITRIVDERGTVVFEAHPEPRQVIPSTTAYQVTSMLQSVIERGTGRKALELGRPAAGKTGTTNDFTDAWFMGFTPQLLAGVWIGFDEKHTIGNKETGGKIAAPIWTRFMERALEDQPIEDFPVPGEIVLTPVNPRTGERAIPGDGSAILEAFRRGTEPTRVAAVVTEPQSDTDIAVRNFLREDD